MREGLWAAGGLVAQAAALLVGTRLITEFIAPAPYGSFLMMLALLALAESVFCKPLLQAQLRLYTDLSSHDEVSRLRRAVVRWLGRTTGVVCVVLLVAGATLGARFGVGFGVTDEPDLVFDGLLAVAREQPKQLLSRHYRVLLEWLTRRTGFDLWIEKSGTSLEYAPELKAFFPDARFVYLHRDAYETALSMREYDVLRLAIPVMNGLLGEVEYSHAGLLAFERDKGAEIDRTLASRPPVELFGRYWAGQIERGLPALAKLDPDDLLVVRFEDLVTRPGPTLTRIAAFFGIAREDDDWIARAAGLVRGLPPTRFDGLPEAEQRALEGACRPGLELARRFEANRGQRAE